MKKFFLSALMLGAFYTAQAQTNLTGTAAASRAVLSMSATELSRQMYNDLELNEGQYVKIKALNQARLDRFNEIERMYANDTQMRDAKIAEVNSQLDEEFAQILTPKQFTAYLELDGRGSAPAMSVTSGITNSSTASDTTSATKKAAADVKMKDDKLKIETGSDKVKVEEEKMKMESSYGEMKIKKDGTEKLKTDDVKYKSSPSETKIKTPNGKTKVEADKVKTKTESSKKKTKN